MHISLERPFKCEWMLVGMLCMDECGCIFRTRYVFHHQYVSISTTSREYGYVSVTYTLSTVSSVQYVIHCPTLCIPPHSSSRHRVYVNLIMSTLYMSLFHHIHLTHTHLVRANLTHAYLTHNNDDRRGTHPGLDLIV